MVDGSNAPQANEVAAAVEASPLPWSSARDSPEKKRVIVVSFFKNLCKSYYYDIQLGRSVRVQSNVCMNDWIKFMSQFYLNRMTCRVPIMKDRYNFRYLYYFHCFWWKVYKYPAWCCSSSCKNEYEKIYLKARL